MEQATLKRIVFPINELFPEGLSDGKGEQAPNFLKKMRPAIKKVLSEKGEENSCEIILNMTGILVNETSCLIAIQLLAEQVVASNSYLILENVSEAVIETIHDYAFGDAFEQIPGRDKNTLVCHPRR
jgi:anti-anti-sigma regulatory factor